MFKFNEMEVLTKIVGKMKINRIRSQQIREFCGIEPINEWVETKKTKRMGPICDKNGC